jgi:hypothetical protein
VADTQDGAVGCRRGHNKQIHVAGDPAALYETLDQWMTAHHD